MDQKPEAFEDSPPRNTKNLPRIAENLQKCRPNCGACCIAPSISTPIPPSNPEEQAEPKPAGLPCRWLDAEYRCLLFGKPERPAVCQSLKPEPEMCGTCREDALHYLELLESETQTG